MKYKPRKMSYSSKNNTGYVITNEGISYKKEEKSAINKDNMSLSIWELWHNVSKRDDDIHNNKIVKIIDENINDWRNAPLHTIELMVRSAVYNPPKLNDEFDIKRLCLIFTSSQSRKSAQDSMNNITCKPYYYHSIESVENNINNIMRLLNIEDYNDLADKEQSSIMALSELDQQELVEMIDIARDSLPGKVKPSDVVLVGKNLTSLYPATSEDNAFKYGVHKKKTKDTTYDAGRSEESSLFSDSMEVDLDASQMIIEGYSTEDILAFHKDVPRGYWNDVLDYIAQGEDDLREIYNELDKKYKWHPEDRRKPDLY